MDQRIKSIGLKGLACALAALVVCALLPAGVVRIAHAAPTDTGVPLDATTRGLLTRQIDIAVEIPTAYSLTNLDEITPVKLQNPWGDCWAFAIASAIESSILKAQHDMEAEVSAAAAAMDAVADGGDEGDGAAEGGAAGTGASGTGAASDAVAGAGDANESADAVLEDATLSTAAEDSEVALIAKASATPQLLSMNDTIDLSERAIAWFAHKLQTEASAGTQSGEGYQLLDPSDAFNQLAEGNFKMVESLLTSGQILVAESTVPYQYNDYSGNPPWYSLGSPEGSQSDARTHDWSVDESLRVTDTVAWAVTDVFKLPSPAVTTVDPGTGLDAYSDYDASATVAIKEALMDVGAVAIALDSDTSIPAEVASGNFDASTSAKHFSYGSWSQYNGSELVDYNHAVAIVGWDDNYSAANFSGTSSGQPPANGAWLCKNNWGSDALYDALGIGGDSTHWGLRADAETGLAASAGESGEASGFFWLSYYDHSIQDPTAFGVRPTAEAFDTTYQYDYLGSAEYSKPSTYTGDVWVGNVFTAGAVELLQALSVETFDEDETVEVEVYALDAAPATTADLSDMTLLASARCTFPNAGFHTLELNRPVLLNAGQRFFVTAKTTTLNNGEESSYLSIEIAYQDVIEGAQFVKGNVVANPGESFISIKPGEWIPIDTDDEDFLNEIVLQGNLGLDFGNALIKAYTTSTTMADRGQIYTTERISQANTPRRIS